MQFSEKQAHCLSVMEVPIWRLRVPSESLFMMATHPQFQLATLQPANPKETCLWEAILEAIQVTSTEEVASVTPPTLILGQNGLPSLSDMLQHPEQKAHLWHQIRQ